MLPAQTSQSDPAGSQQAESGPAPFSRRTQSQQHGPASCSHTAGLGASVTPRRRGLAETPVLRFSSSLGERRVLQNCKLLLIRAGKESGAEEVGLQHSSKLS